MARKAKESYKKLTANLILKRNPKRTSLSGEKGIFDDLISKAASLLPFDSKKAK